MQPDIRLPREHTVLKYCGNITQVGTAIPTVVELINRNNLEITWTRPGVGNYTGTFTNWLPADIELSTCAQVYIQGAIPSIQYRAELYENKVDILTFGAGYEDECLENTPIEINIFTEKI